MKLNLGCGWKMYEGYEHYDKYPVNPETKYIDLEKPLQFESNYADEILILSIVEHIKNRMQLIGECYRVLKDDGILVIGVPFFRYHEVGGCFSHERGFNLDAARRLSTWFDFEVIKEEIMLFDSLRFIPKKIAYFLSLYGVPFNMVRYVETTLIKKEGQIKRKNETKWLSRD